MTSFELHSFSHLEDMVSKPTWKELLLELISSNKIDPWNLDLIQLSDAFLKKMKDFEKMDFVMPANVILAASLLLKYKSNYLKFLNYQSELPEFIEEIPADGAPEYLAELTFSSRIPPKRQITIDELLGEMERIIKYDTTERVIIPKGSISETIDLELPERDIEKDIELVFGKIKEATDSEGWSLFSGLTKGNDLRETVYSLLCVLYLVQRGSIDLRQDKIFGEVFIRLL